VAALDKASARRVAQLIASPPNINKYLTLKNSLICKFSLTPLEKVARIAESGPLQHLKPSEIMDEWSALLGGNSVTDNIFFEYHYRKALGSELQSLLAAVPFNPITTFVAQADYFWVTRQQLGSTSQASAVMQVRNRPNSRPAATSSSRTSTRQTLRQPPESSTVCFYHFNYGIKARQCRQPCNWASVNACSLRDGSGNDSPGHL
jgi:hypothetical protein